jgi:intracellular septation protein
LGAALQAAWQLARAAPALCRDTADSGTVNPRQDVQRSAASDKQHLTPLTVNRPPWRPRAAYTTGVSHRALILRLTLPFPDQIMKFLFDLFPIILFFVAFKIWGIFTATAVAIVATLVQIAWVAFRHRKVDPMLWVSLGVVTVFGGATLVLHNDTFIKWKPTVLYWAFSVALVVSQMAFNKNLIEAMMGKQITLPHAIWSKLSLIWAAFFVLLGLVNLFVAYHYTTDQWVNFKLFGATGCLLVFIVGQSLWLSKYMKEE